MAVARGLCAHHPRRGADGIFLLAAAIRLFAARHLGAAEFQGRKDLAIIGSTIGFVVWFFGFMVVGGEWFLMWQSEVWNGQQPAFRFYMTILAVLIFVMQRDEL